MTTTFGPQLIGETEKTLNALLQRSLEPTGLDERRWVTLRLASQYEGAPGGLAAQVADRAHFADAGALVADLHGRGLLTGDRPTPAATELLERILGAAGPIWADVPDADAAARALAVVLARARAVLDETAVRGGPR